MLVLAIFVVFSAIAPAQEPAPFELSGFSASEIFSIKDEQPLVANDPDLSRLLRRASKCSDRALRRFEKMTGAVSFAELADTPDDFRCHAVRISGTAIHTQPIKLGAVDAYAVQLVDDSGASCLLIVDRIPQAWLPHSSISEPVSATGFFLANFDMVAAANVPPQITIPDFHESIPIVVAGRLSWFPTGDQSDVKIKNSWRVLAQSGVDVAGFDRLEPTGKLSSADSDLFYQMLNACQSIEPDTLESRNSVFDFLQQPVENVGEFVEVSGYLRRATRIEIADEREIELMGQDYYYQLDVFVPLDQKVVIRGGDKKRPANSDQIDTSKDLVIENRYPVIVCVPELPGPAKSLEREQVMVSGFFLKLWNYDSVLSARQASTPQLISPMLIGLKPVVFKVPANSLDYLFVPLITAGALIAALLLYLISVARSQRRASNRRTDRQPEQIEIPPID